KPGRGLTENVPCGASDLRALPVLNSSDRQPRVTRSSRPVEGLHRKRWRQIRDDALQRLFPPKRITLTIGGAQCIRLTERFLLQKDGEGGLGLAPGHRLMVRDLPPAPMQLHQHSGFGGDHQGEEEHSAIRYFDGVDSYPCYSF